MHVISESPVDRRHGGNALTVLAVIQTLHQEAQRRLLSVRDHSTPYAQAVGLLTHTADFSLHAVCIDDTTSNIWCIR